MCNLQALQRLPMVTEYAWTNTNTYSGASATKVLVG